MKVIGATSFLVLSFSLLAGCAAGGGDSASGDGDGDTGDGDTGDGDGGLGTGGTPGDGDGDQPGDGDGDLGSGGTVGTGGTPGTGGEGTGGSSPAMDCASLPVCDDFEAGSVEAAWMNILGYGNEISPSNIALDSTQAHSGTSSIKVTPSGTAPVGISTAPPGNSLYLRAWIKTEGSVAGSLLAVGDAGSHGDEIRLRVRDGYVTLNSAGGGDGLAPDPAGCSAGSCVVPPADWFCAEMYFDLTSETATLWIDGTEAASVAGNVGWHSGGSFPTPGRVWFGSLAPTGGPPTAIYYDDIAIGTSRIGCD